MKVYIVGSVASGKSTFARKMSNIINVPCTHLDGIVHVKDISNKEWGNYRRTDDEIRSLFHKVIGEPHWIIEDAGRKFFSEGMAEADIIIHLKPGLFVRKRRILTRYFKQKIGLEESIYTPSFKMLKFMFKALHNYESGEDDLEERLCQHADKTLLLKTKNEMKQFLSSLVYER
jgi:adenylate kinase family enzyme